MHTARQRSQFEVVIRQHPEVVVGTTGPRVEGDSHEAPNIDLAITRNPDGGVVIHPRCNGGIRAPLERTSDGRSITPVRSRSKPKLGPNVAETIQVQWDAPKSVVHHY